MNNWQNEKRSERVIIALDCEVEKAISIVNELKGEAKWVKIGMTLYYAYGEMLVRICKECGFNVFLDLKFFDIPHQVKGAAKSATLTGADMLTMHAVGGQAMMKAALEGISELSEGPSPKVKGASPATLAITVLTSMNQTDLTAMGVSREVETQVKALAEMAHSAGLSGVVASPKEAKMLRAALGEDALIVTPGVRPAGADVGDQSRVTTPAEAFNNGASHIVVGRPITAAADPISAFRAIAAEVDA